MPDDKKEAASAPSTPSGGSGGSDVEQNKGMAAIGYIGILFLIPLLAKKDSPYAQYHAKQGMILFIFWIAISIVNVIPVLGQIISAVGGLFALVLFIIGLMNALNGKKEPLPVIGQFADKFNI